MSDVIDALAEVAPGSRSDELRRLRPQARENAQRSFEVLFEPAEPGTFPLTERYAVAAYTVGLQASGSPAAAFYAELLAEESEDPALTAAVAELAARDRVAGPYGEYREPRHAEESVPGPGISHRGPSRPAAISERLAAALEHAHLLSLHPRDARPRHLLRLERAGWSADDVVTLSQLISFLSFQIRVVDGLRTLAGLETGDGDALPSPAEAAAALGSDGAASEGAPEGGTPGSQVLLPGDLHRPEGFTQDGLGWEPWLAPVPEAELSAAQREALIDEFRIRSDYFRLLVRNPEALHARTLTDKDIFYTTDGGLDRAAREIAASAASRLNGCVYCASVHTARATAESGRGEVVQRLLDEGVEADMGEVWSAVTAAAVALTRTPSAFGPEHVRDLYAAGLDDVAVVDAVNGAAFFNWANRLMLSLGEPTVPARRR